MVFDWSIYPMFRLRGSDSSRDDEKLPVSVWAELFLESFAGMLAERQCRGDKFGIMKFGVIDNLHYAFRDHPLHSSLIHSVLDPK